MKHLKLFEEFLLSRINEAENSHSDYPQAAKKNAQKAIDWKEKYGREEVGAGTAVGWARAHQLANGENISSDTVKRMSSFNRHRKNATIAPELKETPWKDRGYVAWLIWGGDEGVDWAMARSKEIDALEEAIITESDSGNSALKKVYLATKRSSGQRWWSYKGFAGDKYFTQITENNIDKIDINPDYPILNYQSDLINQLLKEGRIKEENVYNKPKDIKMSGSKKEFHKLVEGDDAIPKTVFSKNEALNNLKFPIIAKPSEGHSGLGIQIFDKPELLEDADEKIFDTYSEFVDKAEEHRFMNFGGKPIFWMARTPDNEKAKTGKGGANEEMSFEYQRKDVKDIPKDYAKVLKRFCKIYEKFPFICFDMMKSKDGKVYVIESNAQPGVPFDSTVEMYKGIYEDFYKKPIDSKSMKTLDSYSQELIKKTLEKEKGRFS